MDKFCFVLFGVLCILFLSGCTSTPVKNVSVEDKILCSQHCGDSATTQLSQVKFTCMQNFVIPANVTQQEINIDPKYNKEYYCQQYTADIVSKQLDDCIKLCR